MESHSTPPSFRLHTPTVDFIENRLPQYHPAFDTRYVEFDASKARFVPSSTITLAPRGSPGTLITPGVHSSPQESPRQVPGMLYDMTFWQELFPKAMDMLKADPKPKSAEDKSWGIRHLSTWADVQAKLDIALEKYDFHHGSQHVSKFRRWTRSGLDKYAVTLQQGAKLVPELDIAKPIIGAIRVVLDAYRQSSKVRKEVITNFDDLPEAFEKIDFYLRTYPKDRNIVRTSCNLIHCIFIAIERAVAFYTSHQVKRAGIALFSGTQYQENLLESLQDIKTGCSALESQANMSLAHRVASDNSQMMQQNATILEETNINQHVLGSIYQQTHMSHAAMINLTELFNIVLPLLGDLQRDRQSHSPIARTPSPLPLLIEAQPIWDPQNIWYQLRIPNMDEEDLKYVAEHTELILHEERGRTQQLLGHRLFRNWMRGGSSAKLLVHGNFRPPYDISPLSAISTLLTHTFRSYGYPFVGIAFFCGRHLIWDEHRGGTAMIRSMISQLLRQYSFALIQPDPWVPLKNLEAASISYLCEIFTALVRQLPSNMLVFCIIDGIGLYETEEYLDGMDIVIMNLVDLVEQSVHASRPCFKLLITSPQPTLEVWKVFESEPDSLLQVQSLPVMGGDMSRTSVREQLDLDEMLRLS